MEKAYSNRSNANRAAAAAHKKTGVTYKVVEVETGFALVALVAAVEPEVVVVPQTPWPWPRGIDFPQPVVVRATRQKGEVRNGVRKPQKGVCADLWAAFEAAKAEGELTIADVRTYAQANGLNTNNATLEFYGWRKFYA